VRRRILELLADGEQTSGALCAVIQAEFGISEPGVSAHLHGIQNVATPELPEYSDNTVAVVEFTRAIATPTLLPWSHGLPLVASRST
jgi:Bacterial regulatory protein, arsR family